MAENLTFLATIRKYVSASTLLVLATVAALIVANLPWSADAYANFWLEPVSLSIGGFNLFSHGGHAMTVLDFINDFLMFFFFLSVGLEIKREVLCGELSTRQKALLPIIGACGGMAVPTLIFYLVCHADPVAARGCAIPMATDIAFSLGVLSLFSKRVPLGLKMFLAALAVADDLGGIIVIAIFYSDHLAWQYLVAGAIVVAILLWGNYKQWRAKTFYLGWGLVLWYCVLNSGIHATIAGVILAFCIPASLGKGTSYYIGRIKKLCSVYPNIELSEAERKKAMVISDDDIQVLRQIEVASDHLISPLQDIEDDLNMPINYLVIPIFAFANAGVCMAGMHVGDLFHGVALGVMLGLLLGKFTGVLSFSWVAIKTGVCQKPEHTTWKAFASVCMLCGIGFTVSMFLAALSYPGTVENAATYLNEAKLGILCGTILSALTGCWLLNMTLPKEEVENQTT